MHRSFSLGCQKTEWLRTTCIQFWYSYTFGCRSILYAVCWNCLISLMMWEICKTWETGCSFLTVKHTLALSLDRTLKILPFSSSRSWPSCLLCSLVFPPQWKPGLWGTSPDRAHREDHSWWEKHTYIIHLRCTLALLIQYKTMSLNWTHFFKASLRFLNLPSDETSFCSLSINPFVWRKKGYREHNEW